MKAVVSLLLTACAAGSAVSAEITSNGTGGGLWSDPATWHGRQVPGPRDDVAIRKYDVVSFDRIDETEPSCHRLQIDPKGVLQFKVNAGRVVCTLPDVVESFGTIKLDGTRSVKDHLELRLTGDRRRLILRKGAGLLLYGHAQSPPGKKNVSVYSVGAERQPAPWRWSRRTARRRSTGSGPRSAT